MFAMEKNNITVGDLAQTRVTICGRRLGKGSQSRRIVSKSPIAAPSGTAKPCHISRAPQVLALVQTLLTHPVCVVQHGERALRGVAHATTRGISRRGAHRMAYIEVALAAGTCSVVGYAFHT